MTENIPTATTPLHVQQNRHLFLNKNSLVLSSNQNYSA